MERLQSLGEHKLVAMRHQIRPVLEERLIYIASSRRMRSCLEIEN